MLVLLYPLWLVALYGSQKAYVVLFVFKSGFIWESVWQYVVAMYPFTRRTFDGMVATGV